MAEHACQRLHNESAAGEQTSFLCKKAIMGPSRIVFLFSFPTFIWQRIANSKEHNSKALSRAARWARRAIQIQAATWAAANSPAVKNKYRTNRSSAAACGRAFFAFPWGACMEREVSSLSVSRQQ